jgi:hypothetical protein
MYLKISASHEFFNPKEGFKTLLFDPPRLAPHQPLKYRFGGLPPEFPQPHFIQEWFFMT